MGLILPQYVEINIVGNMVDRYENKGYYIPKSYNKDGKLIVKKGTKIKAHVLDLGVTSHVAVKAICDGCGKTFDIPYKNVVNSYCVKKINKLFCKHCYRTEIAHYHINTESIWDNKEYALQQLDNFIKKYKTLKGMTVNNVEGNRVNVGLRNHKYNVQQLCEELGYDYLKLKGLYYPEGYLDSFDNFSKEVHKFIDKNGCFPTLRNFKYDLHIPQSIIKKYGTMEELKKQITPDNNDLLEDDRGFYNRSYYEYIVAQFLIHNNVDYLREQHPFPRPYNMLRSDFTIYDINKNIYQIELWDFIKQIM